MTRRSGSVPVMIAQLCASQCLNPTSGFGLVTAAAAAYKLPAMPTHFVYSNMQSPWSPSVRDAKDPASADCRAGSPAAARNTQSLTPMKTVLPVRDGHKGRPSRTRKTRKCRIPDQDVACSIPSTSIGSDEAMATVAAGVRSEPDANVEINRAYWSAMVPYNTEYPEVNNPVFEHGVH
jgi:hypothetical protein